PSWTALVVLAGGVQEARAPPEGHWAPSALRQAFSNLPQQLRGTAFAVEVGHDGEVATLLLELCHQSRQHTLDAAGAINQPRGAADLDTGVGKRRRLGCRSAERRVR